MYFGPPCYGKDLDCYFVYLALPGTHQLLMRKQVLFFYSYAFAKCEIHICSNKLETGLVDNPQHPISLISLGWALYG